MSSRPRSATPTPPSRMCLCIIPVARWNQEGAIVRPQEHAVPRADWGSAALVRPAGPLASLADFVRKTLVIVELEARKLLHDPSELITRAVQPMLWLLIFGQVFTRVRAIPTGNVPYIDFM